MQTATKPAALVVGQKVMCNGFEGRVYRTFTGEMAGMVEVRVPGGVTCVSVSEVIRFTPVEWFSGAAA